MKRKLIVFTLIFLFLQPNFLFAKSDIPESVATLILLLLSYRNEALKKTQGLENLRQERKLLESFSYFYSGYSPAGAASITPGLLARRHFINEDINNLKTSRRSLALSYTLFAVIFIPLMALGNLFRNLGFRNPIPIDVQLAYAPAFSTSAEETGRWLFRVSYPLQ